MTAIESLVLKMRAPAKLFLGSIEVDDGLYVLENGVVRSGYPPWPSAADLLYNSATRELCGVTYQVSPEDRDTVVRVAHSLDPACVRFVDGLNGALRSPYLNEAESINFLEITWSTTRPDSMKAAQLTEDFWLYSESTVDPTNTIEGYALSSLSSILAAHDLVLPSNTPFPSTSFVVAP